MITLTAPDRALLQLSVLAEKVVRGRWRRSQLSSRCRFPRPKEPGVVKLREPSLASVANANPKKLGMSGQRADLVSSRCFNPKCGPTICFTLDFKGTMETRLVRSRPKNPVGRVEPGYSSVCALSLVNRGSA